MREAPKRDILAIIDFIRSAPVNLNLNDLSDIVYVLSWVTLLVLDVSENTPFHG
jgi:hypothetical protein